MKRILIALAVLLSVQVADAQVKSSADAKKAVEAATAATQNPKKAVKPATWIKLASAYIDAYDSPMGNAWIGAGQQELSLIMGPEKPLSAETVVLGGETYTKQVYQTRNYYFNNAGVLSIIEVTQPVYENPLAEAFSAYQEAYKVDAKGSKTKDIVAGIKNISSKYLGDGMNWYLLGDMKKASDAFASAAEVVAVEPVNEIDTTAAYNAGFTAWMIKDYGTAAGWFGKCIAAGYYEDGEVYAKLADCQLNLADTTAAVTTFEKGFEVFPQSQSLLIGLINYYIGTGDNPERLFELINKAKENEPNNASLYYVEGNINKELGKYAEAEAAYLKSNEINPEYEFGLIGIGIMYYDRALELQEEAQNEFDDDKYNALVAQFESSLRSAIEPFEQAFAITKDQNIKVSIAEYLKNIYYRFSTDPDPKYMEGYKKYDAIVSSGVAQ